MKDFEKDFLNFKFNGFVSSEIKPSTYSGNSLLYTSEYYLGLFLRGRFHKKEFKNLLKQCEVFPGLYKRHPESTDYEAVDDYVGLTTASYFIAPEIAKDVLLWGRNAGYCYNNKEENFRLKSWFGRFPAIIAHFHYAAGYKPNVFLRLAWQINMVLCYFSKEQDPKMHGVLMALVHDSWISRKFLKKVNMSQIMENYFGFRHPLCDLWDFDYSELK